MVSYYSLKHLAAAEARNAAGRLLRADMPVSSRNLILAERMHLARNWNEYLRDAIRQPVGETTNEGDAAIESSGKYLDDEAGLVLNSAVPLATLQDVASNSALPAHVRDELARTAFARSVLLSRNPDFAGILKLLRSPGISPWVFRMISSDSVNGLRIARFCRKLGRGRAAILYENDSYGRGLAEAFRRNFSGDVVSIDPIGCM